MSESRLRLREADGLLKTASSLGEYCPAPRSARDRSVYQCAVRHGDDPAVIVHQRGLDGTDLLDDPLEPIHGNAVTYLIQLPQIDAGDDLADRIPAAQPHGQCSCRTEGDEHDGDDGVEQLGFDLQLT